MTTPAGKRFSASRWASLPPFILAALLLAPLAAGADALSDAELESITAAGGPTASSVSEPSAVAVTGHGGEHVGADRQGSAYWSGGEGPADASTSDSYGRAVAGAGSVHSFDSESTVVLEGSAQAGARAVNLVNVSSGDSATGVNLSAPGGAGEGISINQINDVSQAAGPGALMAGWSSGPTSSVSSHEAHSAAATTSSFLRDTERIRFVSGRTVETTSEVSVDNPRLTVPDAITPEPVTFGFEVRKTVRVPDPVPLPGDDATDFTFDFSVTGAELRLPTVDLTGPSITADRAVVGLPDIDLGSVFVSRGTPDSDGACSAVKGCIRRSFDLGTLNGRQVTLEGPVEIFRNPFHNAELDIPVGVGAAAYGTGTAAFGPSSDRLSFAARLDLSNILKGLGLDLFGLLPDGTDLPVVGEDPKLVGSPDLTDFFPEVEFSPVVFEETNPGFTLEARGEPAPVCAGDGAGCSGNTTITTVETTAPEKTVETGGSFRSAEHMASAFTADYRAGTTAAGAEGGYIIIGGGGLDASAAAVVGLGGSAQSGMAVLNSVNATATVVGNALNAGGAGRPAGLPASATQGNRFIQYR